MKKTIWVVLTAAVLAAASPAWAGGACCGVDGDKSKTSESSASADGSASSDASAPVTAGEAGSSAKEGF